jgi:hypothetical protein
MCDDMHDCSTSTGDTWLANNLPAMIAGVGPRGLVILTWDEDDKNSANHILTVFAGAAVKANLVSTQTISHYTVVRTICDVLGLIPFGNAVTEIAAHGHLERAGDRGGAPPARGAAAEPAVSRPVPHHDDGDAGASLGA